MENGRIKAVRDMVIVECVYEEKKNTLYIPDNAKQYHGDFYGVVIAIGPDYKHDLKVGQKVMFRRHEGTKVIIDNKEYLALKEKWVEAIIEDTTD